MTEKSGWDDELWHEFLDVARTWRQSGLSVELAIATLMRELEPEDNPIEFEAALGAVFAYVDRELD